ncbi:MAG: hypothetical protein ACOC4I_04590, partial [Spirochaetota bacterium]
MIDRIRNRYRDASIVVRTKAPQLLITLSTISLLVLVPTVTTALAGEYLNTALDLVIFGVMVGSILLLINGHYRAASTLSLAVASLAMIALATIADYSSPLGVYTVALYLIPSLLLSFIASETEWPILGLGVIGIGVIVGITYGIAVPSLPAELAAEVPGHLITSLTIYVLVAAMAFLSARYTRNAMERVETLFQDSERTINRIMDISSSAESSVESTEAVRRDYGIVGEKVEEITTTLSYFGDAILDLQNSSGKALNAVRMIAERALAFHGQVDEQNTVVQETTAAVNEMSASLDSVAGITRDKQAASERLLVVTQQGISVLEQA